MQCCSKRMVESRGKQRLVFYMKGMLLDIRTHYNEEVSVGIGE